MFKNIFQTPVSEQKTVTYEMQDFCFESAMLDIQYVMEDAYLEINGNHMYAVHTGLKDGNINILEEGLKDFVNESIEFFKRLIKKFTEFMKKVFMYLNAYIGDFEKFIKRHSKVLLEKDPNFTIQGFKFTIDSSVPDTSVVQEMISEFNNGIASVDSMTKAKIVESRNKAMSDSNLNTLRARVLRTNSPIEKDDYSDMCKKVFRDGDTTEDTIQVNKEALHDIVNSYTHLAKLYKESKKEKDRLISLLESIRVFFEKGASLSYINGKASIKTNRISPNAKSNGITKDDVVTSEHTTDKMVLYNTYFNFKFAYAKEVSNMCVTAMTERVNALKEQLTQSRKIVRMSLSDARKGDETNDAN